MTWTAPEITRPYPPQAAGERATLEGYLEFRHLAEAERAWFRREFRGERLDSPYARDGHRDAALEEAGAGGAEADYARLIAEPELARRAVAGAALDDEFTHAEFGRESLRGVFNHLIGECARHNGHADLLRQCIDGATGD
jgi:Protein of unknown function (DUF664)